MSWLSLAVANFRRHRARTAFTGLSVAAAFAIFALLAAFHAGFVGGLHYAQAARMITINRLLNGADLPISYRSRLRTVPGLAAVAWSKQLSGYYRTRANPIYIQAFSENILQVYPEFRFDAPGQAKAYLADQHGLIAGAAIAARNGWNVGQEIPLEGGPLQRNGSRTWLFRLDGIFGRNLPLGYQTLIVGHYRYYNTGVADPALKDRVHQFDIRLKDVRAVRPVAHRIDAMFNDATPQTITFSEQQMVLSGLSEFGDVSALLIAVATAVFFTLLLITANTMAHSVHERMGQFAMLRALGLGRAQILWLVMTEAGILILPGAALGFAAGWALCDAVARYVGELLQAFGLNAEICALAAVLALAFVVVSGAGPGRTASRLEIATALRKEG